MEKGYRQRSLFGVTLCVSLCVLCFGVMAIPASAQEMRLNVGAGVGIPYSGVVGAMVEGEFIINNEFSLAPSFAVGHTILADFGWDAGVKGLFLDKKSIFRPGAAVFYGTNLLLEDEHSNWSSKRGASFGVMGRFQFGPGQKHCVDVYILYPTTDYDKHRYSEQGTSVKLAVGYTMHLD